MSEEDAAYKTGGPWAGTLGPGCVRCGGAPIGETATAWRWDGWHWQHQCPRLPAQVGHLVMGGPAMEASRLERDGDNLVLVHPDGERELFSQRLHLQHLADAIMEACTSDEQVAEVWERISVDHPCGFPVAFRLRDGRGAGLLVQAFGAASVMLYDHWPITRSSGAVAVFMYPRMQEGLVDLMRLAISDEREPARWYRADRDGQPQQRRPEYR